MSEQLHKTWLSNTWRKSERNRTDLPARSPQTPKDVIAYVCSRSCCPSRCRGSSRNPARSDRTSVPQRQVYRSTDRWPGRTSPCRSRRRYTDRYLRRSQPNITFCFCLWQSKCYVSYSSWIEHTTGDIRGLKWAQMLALLDKVCLGEFPFYQISLYPSFSVCTFTPQLTAWCSIFSSICALSFVKIIRWRDFFFLLIQCNIIIIIPWIKMKHFQLCSSGSVTAVKDNEPPYAETAWWYLWSCSRLTGTSSQAHS